MSFEGPLTEAAVIHLVPGTDIETPNSQGTEIWSATLKTLSEQPGFQRAYYGRRTEDLNFLQLCIDWDSFKSHQDFMERPVYSSFLERFGPILAGPPALSHFSTPTFPPTILSTAPVIEYATFFDTTSNFISQVDIFKTNSEIEKAPGFVGGIHGPIMEEIERKEGDGKAKACLIIFGWESKEKHEQFTTTKLFQDSIGALLAEAHKGAEMYHVVFKTFN